MRYGDSSGVDGDARMQMNTELERVKEQSRLAIDQSLARAEALRREQQRISEILNEKERKLNRLKMMKSMGNASELSKHDGDTHVMLNDESTHSHSSKSGDKNAKYNPDNDVRIQLMIQEREEKIHEINEIIYDKEIFLQSLQDDTEEQQETIHELQKVLEDLQAASGNNIEQKVKRKELDVEKLEEELDRLQKELTEDEQNHLELEDEWNEREDLVADTEADSADKLSMIQKKIEKYSSEIASKGQTRLEMIDDTSQRLEGMRQNFMEVLGPETCHRLMGELRTSFDILRHKEDELASALVRRMDERKALIPPTLRLEILSRQCSNALRKLSNFSDLFEAKMRHAHELQSSEVAINQINFIQDQVASSFEETTEELGLRLDNMEQHVIADGDGTVGVVKRSLEKVNYSMKARFRQLLRTLPEAVERSPDPVESAEMQRRSSRLCLRVQSLQSAILEKEEELKGLTAELAMESEPLSEQDRKKIELLEDEIEFISKGIIEKDKMIDVIRGVTKERRDAEAYLLQELDLAYRNGIINANDFGESDQSLLEKIRGFSN